MRRLARELFGHLSLGLGLEKGAMAEAFGGDGTVFLQKINYYPPCPQPELTLGVAAHTDMSTLTVLVPNDVQGLQVFRDGRWYDVEYVPDALIVHIGDQIEARFSTPRKMNSYKILLSSLPYLCVSLTMHQ
jgi:flavonol synthase